MVTPPRPPGRGASLDRLLSAASFGLLVLDEEGAVLFANDAARNLFGLDDRLVGSQFGVPVGSETTSVVQVRGADGQLRDVEMRATSTTWTGRRVMLLELADVSERVEQIRRLEGAITETESLVGTVGHELRNPLSVISGMAETLKDLWGVLDDEQKLHLLDRIVVTSREMHVMCGNFLEISRIDSGAVRASPEPLFLSEWLLERLVDLGGRAALVRIDCSTDAMAMADPGQAWEIVHNLVENALKYGQPPVDISVQAEGALVTIAVSDAGDGVPEEFVGQLFERFARAGQTAALPGTGLGLAISRELARANEGDLRYEPTSGSPSRFVLVLPTPEG